MRSFLIVTAITLLLIYGGMCWFLHAQQCSMLYYGWTTTADPADADLSIQVADTTLRGWVVNRDMPDPILYFGGNAERIESNREDFARLFPTRSVYLIPYRGYGPNPGEPSERVLVADALAIYDRVRALHPGQRIAVIGRSLGSGVASQLAARRPVERLALITPFDSMVSAARAHYPIFPVDWLLHERYESAKALRDFRKPLLIVQAGRDEVVPASCTEALVAALPQRPLHVLVAEADHNDIGAREDAMRALSGFMRR